VKIGFVSEALPYLPSRGGFRLYGGNLLRRLSQRHQIDLISFLEDGDDQHFDWPRQYCSSVTPIPRADSSLPMRLVNVASAHLWGKQLHGRRRLEHLLREGFERQRWDVLHVEGCAAGGAIPSELPLAKVLSVHDSWTLRAHEMLQCAQSYREKFYYTFLKFHEPRYQRLVYPRFDAVTVVAARDMKEVQTTAPNARIALIPYGTDTEYFYPVQVEKDEATLVFHSHLGYAPNIEAVLEFANEILPLILREAPGVTFRIVGANPAPKVQELTLRSGITISANLDDLRPAVCSAQIYVCPIRHGTGLKSKMLEAMAMRMPIVAYHPGSTVGIDCTHGKHLLAAETPQQFADGVLHLLRHPETAERIAQAGRELVEQKYSWESRACAYEELYEQVIERRLRQIMDERSGKFQAAS